MQTDLTLEQKRQLLMLSRVKFGPEFEIPKNKAIDKIVEKSLYLAKESELFSVEQIRKIICDVGEISAIHNQDIEDSLMRLIKSERVTQGKAGLGYRLSKTAIYQIEEEVNQYAGKVDKTISDLFGDLFSEIPKEKIQGFFIACLTRLFSRLGNQWIDFAGGNITAQEFYAYSEFNQILTEAMEKNQIREKFHSLLTHKMQTAFKETNPLFSEIVFLFGQHHYILRLLCLDLPIDMFAKETFYEAAFYLDTMLLINSILISSRHYKVFDELMAIKNPLNLNFCITAITYDELERVINHYSTELSRLFDKVPKNIREKTGGDFFESFKIKKQEDPNLTVEKFFEPLQAFYDNFLNKYNIEIVDNSLFGEFEKTKQYAEIKGILKKHHPNKLENALRHDAINYLWIKHIRTTENTKCWLLTQDRSLPAAAVELRSKSESCYCFTLDGFLQILSPFAESNGLLKSFEEMFASIIGNQILPQTYLFDIRDFQVFQDLEIEIEKLPEEDVEESLIFIKNKILKGGIYTGNHLKEIAYELKKFFKDPSRRFVQIVDEQKIEIQSLKDEVEILKSQITILIQNKLRIGFIKKVFFWMLLYFLVNVLFTFLVTNKFATGTNLLAKIKDFWCYYTLIFPIFLITFRLILNKEEWIRLKNISKKWLKT